MRWNGQRIDLDDGALPGLGSRDLVRTVRSPEFAGLTFHEVRAKSALNHVPAASRVMPDGWTINPYRGCSHACVYCFARPTHEYLEFDAGRDFDTQIVVKTNVVEVLRAELARPGWARAPVALGTNTDPYQRAEGRYALMPGIASALADADTPFSILTKGTLLRRDLPLLARLRERVPIGLSMSIAVYDDDLQSRIEPGAPSTTARLATVTAAREAGFDPTVFLMPVLPFLTDSPEHLDAALARIAAAGATKVLWTPLHLKPGVKEWFAAWLRQRHPEHVADYRELYGDRTWVPKDYRESLSALMRPLVARHRLEVGTEDPATGAAAPTPGWRRGPSTAPAPSRPRAVQSALW